MALDTTIGGASSDSYGTLAAYQAYGAAFGWTLSGVDATDEVNLRLARRYLDTAYVWKGTKVSTSQALEWPRLISGYVEGFPVSSETIPQAVIEAQFEMAYLLQGGATPQATVTTGGILRERKKFDVMEKDTTYASARELAAYPLVDAMVSPYVERKQGAVSGSIPLARA